MKKYKTPVLYSCSSFTTTDLIGPYKSQYSTTISVGGGIQAKLDSNTIEYHENINSPNIQLVQLEKESNTIS